ncbi:MAG: hypothetical protein AB1633_07060 [Elusimicrobiota bacterium]
MFKQSVVKLQAIIKIYPALPKELFKYYSRKGWVYPAHPHKAPDFRQGMKGIFSYSAKKPCALAQG